MKYKTTAKDLKAGYKYIISVGYCNLQSLLSYEQPIAYSSGTYGWNFDIYDVNGVAIATGYRGMPSKNTEKATYEVIHNYEQLSKGKTAEEKKALLKQFIEEVTQRKAA